MAAGCAHTDRRAASLEALAGSWPLEPARALLADDLLELELDAGQGRLVLRASWLGTGLDQHGPRFRVARVELADDARLRHPGRGVAELELADEAAWERLARRVGESLAPATPGQAVLVEGGGADQLLLRAADGSVASEPAEGAGDPQTVARRVGVAEVAGQAIALLGGRAEGERAPPPQLFPVPGRGYLLVDGQRQLAVLVPLPALPPAGDGPAAIRTVRTYGPAALEALTLALVKNPVSSLTRLVNMVAQLIATQVSSGVSSSPGEPPPVADREPMDRAAWERELDSLTGSRPYRGTIRLLVDGWRYFPVLEQRIAEARESVDLQVYIFDNDDVAVAVADQLRRRSTEVRVRVLVDRASSVGAWRSPPGSPMPPGFSPPRSMTQYLERDSRVSARAHLNVWSLADHTKVLLFDRRVAHLGGMNIGREYRHEWHDLMVELEGPIVGRLARDFERAWAHAGLAGDLGFLVAALFRGESFVGPAEPPGAVDLRPLTTRTGNPQIMIAQGEALRRAQRRVLLENPYLYDNSVVDDLVRARRRGVDVRVILPSSSDLQLGDLSNMVTANLLLEAGVRVYVYPGMTHVKALLVDGWACLGSANFNSLSLRRNLETNVATSDPAFVELLERELFEPDLAISRELDRPLPVDGDARLAEWVLNSF